MLMYGPLARTGRHVSKPFMKHSLMSVCVGHKIRKTPSYGTTCGG